MVSTGLSEGHSHRELKHEEERAVPRRQEDHAENLGTAKAPTRSGKSTKIAEPGMCIAQPRGSEKNLKCFKYSRQPNFGGKQSTL